MSGRVLEPAPTLTHHQDRHALYLVQEYASRGDLCDVATCFPLRRLPDRSAADKVGRPAARNTHTTTAFTKQLALHSVSRPLSRAWDHRRRLCARASSTPNPGGLFHPLKTCCRHAGCARASQVALPLTQACAFIHGLGIIHRDIKAQPQPGQLRQPCLNPTMISSPLRRPGCCLEPCFAAAYLLLLDLSLSPPPPPPGLAA